MLSDPHAGGEAPVPVEGATPPPTDRAVWLDLLSEELLDQLPVESWRKLFLGPDYEGIRFVHATTTLLCIEPPAPEWSEAEVRTLAVRFGGVVERQGARVLVSFARARAALEVAMLLQRTCTRRLRSALLTAACVTAWFEVDGESRRLTLGDAPTAANACTDHAPPGSIQLCAATWRALGPAALERQTHRALVTTEYQGDDVISAFITPAPPPRADLSTFAGLGLV